MAIMDLPTVPAIRSATPRLIDFGRTMRPDNGGPSLRINRLGNRFAIDFVLPPLKEATHGLIWPSAIVQARTEGARMVIPQYGIVMGTPGNPTVDGTGQTGMVLAITGAVPGYVVKNGQFITIVHAGRGYAHMVRADTVIASNGKAALPIAPMMRVIPAAGASVKISGATIEGDLADGDVPWDIMVEPYVSLKFSITERA